MTGAAKPNSKIFAPALEIYGCEPTHAWHIGDSLKDNYEGAKSIGIKDFLIDRDFLNNNLEIIATMKDLIR